MRRTTLLILASCGLLFSQTGQQPKQLTVHTQVREDIFAGFMAGDMERFGVGMKKLDDMLRENPESGPALGWRGGAELYLAVRAHEEGKKEEFERLYARSTETIDRALAVAPKDGGVAATTGASLVLFGDRLPSERRLEAFKQGRAQLKRLEAEQKAFLEKLPVHMRGELLAGLAQAAERVGDPDDARTYLNEMVRLLKDTPYERRAQRWLDDPAARKSSIVCLTCHEPGRLANALAR